MINLTGTFEPIKTQDEYLQIEEIILRIDPTNYLSLVADYRDEWLICCEGLPIIQGSFNKVLEQLKKLEKFDTIQEAVIFENDCLFFIEIGFIFEQTFKTRPEAVKFLINEFLKC